MPYVPQYESRVGVSQGYNAPRANAQPISTAVGDGLQRVGQAGGQTVTAVQTADDYYRDMANKAYAGKAVSDAQLKWSEDFNQRKAAAAPGAPDFVPTLLKDYDNYTEEQLKLAPNDDSRRFMQQHLFKLRTVIGREAIDFQAKSMVQDNFNVHSDAIQSQSAMVLQRPELYEQAKALLDETRPNVGPDLTEKLKDTAIKNLTHSAAAGAVLANPQSAYDILAKSIKPETDPKDGKPVMTGVGWVDDMSPTDKVHYLQQAGAAVARNSAMGDRTAAAMEAQLASAIPAPADTITKWKMEMGKAGRLAEVDEYVKNERDVQTMLGLPIEEQIAAKEKMQAQKLKGADLKQQANINRLSSAIDANIKMAEDEPLKFAQLRYGQQIDPLMEKDFNDPAALGAKIQARAEVLAGNKLPQKLFTPLEAGYVSDMLGKLDPKTAGKTYGLFRNAAGDMDTYMAMMMQVANGSKPEAYAGMIWAKQQSVKTGSSWFGEDPSLTADQVATTMVMGARILNQEKGAAGDKKSVSLFLPEDKELQNRFADMVGDAFAGLPEASRNAFNMARTYYAGRAAEKGVIAKDRTLGSVDTSILKEALAVTVGDIATVGAAKVIAPYGMKASEFEQQARDQFLRVTGLDKAGDPGLWNRITLQPIGRDQYRVLAGNQPLQMAPDKPPVVLTFSSGYSKDRYGRNNVDLIPK